MTAGLCSTRRLAPPGPTETAPGYLGAPIAESLPLALELGLLVGAGIATWWGGYRSRFRFSRSNVFSHGRLLDGPRATSPAWPECRRAQCGSSSAGGRRGQPPLKRFSARSKMPASSSLTRTTAGLARGGALEGMIATAQTPHRRDAVQKILWRERKERPDPRLGEWGMQEGLAAKDALGASTS
jgi:hypothetical protein